MKYSSVISAERTFQHLNDKNWRIIDCRFDLGHAQLGFEKFKSSHIPNAVYADLNKDLSSPVQNNSGRHPLPDIDVITQKIKLWGIRPETQVVVYDDAYGSFASRLWWLLHWLGHENVAVLNGGLTHWERLQMPLSSVISTPDPTYFTPKPNMSMIADTPFVEKTLATPQTTIVDVRDAVRFQGLQEPIDKISGHIPGAINLPWKTNLDENGLYFEKSELLRHYEKLINNKEQQNLIFMCGSGVTACHSLVALEYIDYKGAKLYPGSWSEWIQDTHHPVESAHR